MVARKTVCLKRLGGNRKGELGVGRFLGNAKVTTAKIIAGWSQQTGAACAGRHVLAIDDTCELKFPTTAQCRRGLGPVKKGKAYGLLVHAMIAVDAASGACLGLVGGQIWTRDGVNPVPHSKRPLEERESMRWLDAAAQAKRVLHAAAVVTVVDDRESDIYAKWASVPEAGFHMLTRLMTDRRLASGGMLSAAADGFPVADRRTIELRPHEPGQVKRAAVVEMRYGAVEICRPQNEDRSLPKTVRLRLIEVREVDPPADVAPVHWRLLTTHDIADAAAAWQIVGWYQRRWVIEQMHRVMKSQGLQLEDSQVTTAERLEKLAAITVKAACIDIQLTQERDGKHQLPGSAVFTEPEMDTVEALVPTLEGSTERQKNPHPIRSLARASWVVARLGGWNCYYKPP
ncbi:IS4 family transposase, partial [Bradyrhizobium sp.]|uniref:IS4 family transposase n=1 Tax=Bradyrhizobium sp. TaxID=376 RepID=UPI003C3CCBA0